MFCLASLRRRFAKPDAYLFSMLANVAYGSGEPGDSEYGEKAEEIAFVGDGIIGLFRAMVDSAASMLIFLRSFWESLSRDHD